MGPQIFHVLTEFRFDIAHAVANTDTLQGKVEGLSNAANDAVANIQRYGLALVTQMGIGTSGILGFLYNAISASDKFAQSQRNLANIILSNNKVFTGGGFDFAGAMSQSEQVMDNLIGKAREFALDPNNLLDAVKAISPVLIGHGLELNSAMPISTDIARGFLKSAPTLGVDPNLAMGQLTDLAMGRANMGDRLFQRLVSETSAFKDAKITGSQAFNVLPAQKRIELLRQSLLQFGSNADVLKGNMMSLNGQMQVFMSLVKGQFSIFRNLGTVLLEPIKKALNAVNEFLQTKGRKIADTLTRIIAPLVEDPEKLLATIMQIGKLKKDLSMSATILEFMGIAQGIKWVLGLFGIQIGNFFSLAKVFEYIGIGLAYVRTHLGGILSVAMRAAGFLIRHVFFPIILFTTVLQGISKGLAQAKISDMKWIAENMDLISARFEQLSQIAKKVMLPITLAIDGIAMIVEWIFTFGDVTKAALEGAGGFLEILNKIANVFVGLFAVISGMISVVMGRIFAITNMFNKNANFGTATENFKEGFNDFWNKFNAPMDEKKQPSAVQSINIHKVEINNAFKEQAEPDRIAFTLVEQLKKAAINPNGTPNRSMMKPLYGN